VWLINIKTNFPRSDPFFSLKNVASSAYQNSFPLVKGRSYRC
jgi:hypothetical protein